MADDGAPSEERLRDLAERIRTTLYAERRGGSPVGPGPDRESAVEHMTEYLRECGLIVSRPVRFASGIVSDRLAVRRVVIRLMGDQLRAGRRPAPASVGGTRSVVSGLVEDGLVAYANAAHNELRLTDKGEALYREITTPMALRLVRSLGVRTGIGIAIGTVIGIAVTNVYNAAKVQGLPLP